MQTASNVSIISAYPDDVDQLAEMMARAFFDAPDVRWLIPDPVERDRTLVRLGRALLHHTITIGVVDTTALRAAAALWWPHDALDPQRYQELVEQTCGPYAAPILELGAYLAERAPRQPHHYLAYLGVDPDRQGTGLGSALLRHRHAALDRDAQAAYLVATSPRSRDLYLRHGYVLVGQPLQPGEDGPVLWPMWREPLAPSDPT